jgi:hypothetical protein
MSQHYRNSSHTHRTTDVSTTTQHANPPSEIFALINESRILVTIAPYGWRIFIRRESPDEYTVRYENAAGVLSGTFTLTRREARRLVAANCREAVWSDLQPRTVWPESDSSEVIGE